MHKKNYFSPSFNSYFFIKKRNFYSFLRSIELREYNEISSDIEQIGHYQRYITVCMSVF